MKRFLLVVLGLLAVPCFAANNIKKITQNPHYKVFVHLFQKVVGQRGKAPERPRKRAGLPKESAGGA